MNVKENPFESMQADYGGIPLIAELYQISLVSVANLYTDYVMRFRKGPAVFVPWYRRMCDLSRTGRLPYRLPAPADVFPDLSTDDHGFYEAFNRYYDEQSRGHPLLVP